ncbi:MAG: LysM peptidoglycan-binding domain-containing protein [Gammaproteobacteria bacterium]|nr:LysM peptidoglycan-binding domain-containing protein [Gammaproteobacteria bacterium]
MRIAGALSGLLLAGFASAETVVPPAPMAAVPDWFLSAEPAHTAATKPGSHGSADEPVGDGFLDTLRASFSLDHHAGHKNVRAELRWLRDNPKYLHKLAPRMERYLPYLCQEVRARGMPGELCLLPIVESALDPFAFSPGGAAGLWQFIPATGKRYRLKIDWWVDERRDPIASTQAALAYLEDLGRRFDGDWLLAVAAYNWGEGRVARARRRVGPNASFFELKVPRETAAYVPRLLALAAVFDDPEAQGIELSGAVGANAALDVAFAPVTTYSQMDIAKASQALGVDVEEIYRWNPALNQWATHPRGPHRILLPAADVVTAQAAMDNVPEDQRLRWVRHKIAASDTLGQLAQRYDTDVATLKKVNDIRGTMIRQGRYLLIPKSSLAESDYPTPVRRRESRGSVYVVKNGDSLWEISRRTGISMTALMRANHVGPKDVLRTGQRLVLPTSTQREVVRTVRYRVRNGDSLAKIAGKFNVSIADIANWNEIDPTGYIHPGQKLRLLVDVTAPRS